jgi:hypothetical protein
VRERIVSKGAAVGSAGIPIGLGRDPDPSHLDPGYDEAIT